MITKKVLIYFIAAERLSCPHYKVHACACLQKYIIGDGKSLKNYCYLVESII